MCGSFKTLSATLSETVYNLAEYAYLLFLEFFFLFSLGVGVSSGGGWLGGGGNGKDVSYVQALIYTLGAHKQV